MTRQKLMAGAAMVTGLLLGALPAHADILSGLANLYGGGTYNIKLQDYEDFSTSSLEPGTMNYGVYEITSIVTPGGVTAWSSGTGGYLVGVFNGITVATVGNTPIGEFTQNTGGTFDLYEVSSLPNFAQGISGYADAGCSVGSLCYDGITNVGGTLVLSYNLVAGADSADTASTLLASISSTTTVPVTGSASGFADITGGVDAPLFATGAFPTTIGTLADVSVQDDFCGPSGTSCPTEDWEESSQDPVKADLIPEPGSMALLGSALVLLGMVGYRRRNRRGV